MKFLLGFLTALALVVLVPFAYLKAGLAPVATAASSLPLEKVITNMALNARIDKEAPKASPIPPSEENLAAGAHLYRIHCAVCHGLPGQEQTVIARGEFPKPPELFKGKGVSDDPPGETYWKVYNGIRLSGMPAFTGSLTTDQMWQVSLLLANSDKLSPAVHATLEQPLPQ